MKRIFSLLILALLLTFLSPTALAAELPPVIDQAGLLTAQEEASLSKKAAALKEAYGMDIVILTNFSLGGKSPESYADDYYDEHGYGDNGILFLLSMEYRDWYISTCGDGVEALTDYGIQQVGEAALPDLADGRYFEAFDTYLDALVPYLEAYASGTQLDGKADYSGDYYHGTQEEIVYDRKSPSFGQLLLSSLPIGLIISAVAVCIMRTTMNTKRRQGAASCYMRENSFYLRRCQDLFLYSNVSKVRRQENSASSGGSSVHHSASGRSHGGGGGKF